MPVICTGVEKRTSLLHSPPAVRPRPVPVRAGRRCAKGRASPSGISRMPARPWPVWPRRWSGMATSGACGNGACAVPVAAERHPGPVMRSGSRKRRNDASPDDGSFAAGAAGLLLQPAAGAAAGAGPGQGSSGSGAGPARSLSRHRPVRRACGLLTGGACVLALLAGKGAEGEEPHPMLAPCSMITPAGFTSARRPTAATPASRWRWGWERVRRRARSPIPWPVATCWPNAGKRFWS